VAQPEKFSVGTVGVWHTVARGENVRVGSVEDLFPRTY